MDPQKLSQLDPKLRAAYDRVMGTNVPGPQAPVSPQAESIQTQTPPQTFNPIPPPQPQSQSIPVPQPITPPQPTPNVAQTDAGMTTPIPSVAPSSELVVPFQGQEVEEKKNGKGLFILFLLILLIIIAAYILSWMKIIPYKLPLLH